ncbi:dopamine beta-hydroxylase [Sorex araneus]|uniref:dopamine beta-hydroxylase n=1 Tax=Sorex araneus TaxID=42254 RepID=UPI002433C2AA|nr:dopamine beta-hydroxylase [Sorex araneus]
MQVPRPSAREAASMYGTAVAVFLVILVAALQGSAPPEDPFPYHVPLDPEGALELAWNVDYAQETVQFRLLIRGLRAGLLFGMSERGELQNADVVALWTDGDSAYFGDAWTDAAGRLHLDAQQDYQLLQAQSTPEGLALLFKRPFSTCDPKDYFIEDGTVHLVFATLEQPVRSLEAINTSGLHAGLQRVQLLKPDLPAPALPPDTRSLDVRAPDVLIPAQETTYWCYVTELPAAFPRHHIVMYEPIITEGNEALVHHMEVFQCAPQFETVPSFNGPCDSKMKPESLNYCRHVLAAWALGAKAFYYPQEAGVAFGGQGASRFLRLEVHYHNPLRITGRRDASGIRLHYTATLRPFDAGILELGLVYTPVMAIPPREHAFVLTGHCPGACTQLALPPAGIRIFASQLHTHLSGRTVETVLLRDGRERELVNRDPHYSPHFQEIRMLKELVTVRPGDVLVTSCTYNTEDRAEVTVGGFGILQEMCVNYVHYYPRTQLELCKSALQPELLQAYFRMVSRPSGEGACRCPQASVPEQFASVPWSPFARGVLRALYDFAPVSVSCNKSSAVSFPGDWDLQPPPQAVSRLERPRPRCPAMHTGRPAAPTRVDLPRGSG